MSLLRLTITNRYVFDNSKQLYNHFYILGTRECVSAAAAFSLSRSSKFAPVPLLVSILSNCVMFVKKSLLTVFSILDNKALHY